MTSLEALSEAEWLEAAKTALGNTSDDLQMVAVRLAPASVEGDGQLNGFIGDTLRVRVVVKRSDENASEEEVAMFVKVVPEGNVAREALASGTGAFRKESGFYRNMVPRLCAALGSEVEAWAPKCLFVKGSGLIVFEDLSTQGFKTPGGRKLLDFEHCVVALEAVARMHAASLAMEENDRHAKNITPWRLGERFSDLLQEVMFTNTFDNLLSKFVKVSVGSIQTLVELMPEYKNSPQFEEIIKKAENVPSISYDIVSPSEKYRNVICHGDLWVNNIMFKYDDAGKVCAARLVDFQFVRYCPPSLDVQGLLHLACRWPLRRERGPELKDIYYSALDDALKTAGLSAQELVPRTEFDETCDKYATFGRIVTAVYMPCDLLPQEILLPQFDSEQKFQDFFTNDRSALVREAFPKDEFYRHRLREVIAELVEGLLLPDTPKP